MANQDAVNMALHEERRARGRVGSESLHQAGGNVNSSLPTTGTGARRNYNAGTQESTGSH